MFIKKYIEEKIPELSGRLYPVFTTDIEHLTVAYLLYTCHRRPFETISIGIKSHMAGL